MYMYVGDKSNQCLDSTLPSKSSGTPAQPKNHERVENRRWEIYANHDHLLQKLWSQPVIVGLGKGEGCQGIFDLM